MRVAQIVVPDAGEYERKAQKIDFAALSEAHEVTLTEPDRVDADVAHVYGKTLSSKAFQSFPIPFVASAPVRKGRFSLRKPAQPAVIVSPLANVPEAVEEIYFEQRAPRIASAEHVLTIGSFGPRRNGVKSMIDRTLVRIYRFRDDIQWNLFDVAPTAADLAGVDVWVDPTADDEDFDGYVAEAIVAGRPVVASRTPINLQRLEKGRIGFLVPRNDPNEMTHAILTALFKPEVAEQKDNAARQTVSKFRPRRRLRVLLDLYGTLID